MKRVVYHFLKCLITAAAYWPLWHWGVVRAYDLPELRWDQIFIILYLVRDLPDTVETIYQKTVITHTPPTHPRS